MQRTASVLFTTFFFGLMTTGCPEKRVEKEEPAAPRTATDRSGADEKAAAAEEEHGEDPEEHADEAKDEKRPAKKKGVPQKKEQAGDEKDQGGW